jgi:antibiotic biosynthesis monooxygenase (ABM) superfamily enzyme
MPTPIDTAARPPNRHKMVLLTWVGIWPTITIVLSFALPVLLPRFPLPVVTLIVTIFVVPLMGYVVMPTLLRLFGSWVRR